MDLSTSHREAYALVNRTGYHKTDEVEDNAGVAFAGREVPASGNDKRNNFFNNREPAVAGSRNCNL